MKWEDKLIVRVYISFMYKDSCVTSDHDQQMRCLQIAHPSLE